MIQFVPPGSGNDTFPPGSGNDTFPPGSGDEDDLGKLHEEPACQRCL